MANFALQSPPAVEKRPLHRELPPAQPFPMEALGALRSAAEAVQLRTQAPYALCAQSVLAAATLAAQAHRDVELPGGGRKPLTGLFITIAESGERKSSADRVALAPIYRMEESWRAAYEPILQKYLNDRDAWKEARAKAIKTSKGNRAAIREALDAIGPEPKAPSPPMLLVSDPTQEALILHLRDARPSAGIFTAEAGIFVGGHAFNEESRMRTAGLLNTLWDGEPIRRVRVMTGAAFLPGRRCTAHLMMQRTVADRLFGDPMLDGMGLMARMLTVAPDSTAGMRLFRAEPAECRNTLDYYATRLLALLTRPPKLLEESDGLDPEPLVLSHEAKSIWIAFHDAAEKAIGAGGEMASIRAFGAKLAEHAGRLAAVLTIYADPDALEVTGESMAHGVTLAQHYAAEALRLQSVAAVAPDLRLAQKLLTWWQERPDPRLHLATIYQRGPNAISDAATARRIVSLLVEHGYVSELPAGSEVDGAKRRDAWRLLP